MALYLKTIKFRCMARHHAVLRFFLMLPVACLLACNAPEEPNKAARKENSGVHKTFERGPVTVCLDTDRTEITIADRLNLTLSVVYNENYDVELPAFGEKLEQFGIVDYRTSKPELTDDDLSKISRSYVLEPFLSGEYKIPPMTVFFSEKEGETAVRHAIETEEITVHVTSLLPENFDQLTLHDIRPPEDPAQAYGIWLWTAGISVFIFISGVFAFLSIRKRRRNRNKALAIKIPAHQQAFEELSALLAENLVGKGKVKDFYHQISDILRRYIENRFHIRAPELTTEEFLAGIQTTDEFDSAHKLLLKNFLTHCDLVKFARYQPQTEDIQKTVEACKKFILGTREKE